MSQSETSRWAKRGTLVSEEEEMGPEWESNDIDMLKLTNERTLL